jgi:ADP-glucose pyrophosphorylase
MGFCTLGSDHKHVETFVEKPSPRKMFDLIMSNTRDVEVSLGMYVFKRSILESMLEDDMTREIGSISEDIIAPAVESGMHVTTFKHDGLFTVCLQQRPTRLIGLLST